MLLLENILREIKIMKLLEHPNIVKLIEIIELDTKTCLVMEYVDGGDLFEYILNETRLSEPKSAKLFRQIVDAIEYLHQNLVIHRDLKPENILLDLSKDQVKLNDFGLSNFMKPGNLLNTFCGSPHYCSPEIMLESKYIGPEVDVWSMGVILYTMTTGLFPWEGDSLPEVMRNAVKGNYTVPDFISSDCKDLINRMICIVPLKRATIAEIKTHPWLNDGLRIPQCLPKRKKAAEKLDEQVLSKLREFGLNDAESRSNIRDGNYTSQAYVLYNLILDYQQEEERRKKDELKKKSMSVKEILFGNRGRRDSAPVLPDFNFLSSSVEIKETKKQDLRQM